jgi:hypothetical protein
MAEYHYDRIELLDQVRRFILPTRIALDIGCGIQMQTFFKPVVHIRCEPYQEYFAFLRNQRTSEISTTTYLDFNIGWEEATAVFSEGSVDTVFLLDVIEHLGKETALELLAKTLPLATKQVVIFTPLGFMPQHHSDGKDAWGMSGASMQEHKSGWEPADFIGDWDFHICEDFHLTDSLGNKTSRPYGAFFAILTKRGHSINESESLASIVNRHSIDPLLDTMREEKNQVILLKLSKGMRLHWLLVLLAGTWSLLVKARSWFGRGRSGSSQR